MTETAPENAPDRPIWRRPVPEVVLWQGDCLDVLRTAPDNSIDAIVTDPPYGLGFMGKAWDDLPPGLPWARECLRVLKPGGHLLAFGGTRTWHRLAVAVEDAGFEVRDSIAWLHGQGFPKGKGQLKPAFEPVVVGRKRGPIWLNIDGCRVDAGGERFGGGAAGSSGFVDGYEKGSGFVTATQGRWPTNVLLDGDAAAELDEQSGTLTSGKGTVRKASSADQAGNTGATYGAESRAEGSEMVSYGDSGGASRFFPTFRYQAKAPARERPTVVAEDGTKTSHPTVKPLALMRWLVRLVTPPGGKVLDPFAGSGTTVEAALLEGMQVVAIEREADYLPLIEARIARVAQSPVEDAA